jgi:preprotein translocase subunit Sss1
MRNITGNCVHKSFIESQISAALHDLTNDEKLLKMDICSNQMELSRDLEDICKLHYEHDEKFKEQFTNIERKPDGIEFSMPSKLMMMVGYVIAVIVIVGVIVKCLGQKHILKTLCNKKRKDHTATKKERKKLGTERKNNPFFKFWAKRDVINITEPNESGINRSNRAEDLIKNSYPETLSMTQLPKHIGRKERKPIDNNNRTQRQLGTKKSNHENKRSTIRPAQSRTPTESRNPTHLRKPAHNREQLITKKRNQNEKSNSFYDEPSRINMITTGQQRRNQSNFGARICESRSKNRVELPRFQAKSSERSDRTIRTTGRTKTDRGTRTTQSTRKTRQNNDNQYRSHQPPFS